MKKITVFLVAIVFLIAFNACDNETENSSNDTENTVKNDEQIDESIVDEPIVNNSVITEYYDEKTMIYEDYEMNFKMKFNKDVQIHPDKSENLYVKVIISIKDDKVYFLSAYKIYEDITDEKKDLLTTMYRDKILEQVGNKVDNEFETTFLGLKATEYSGKADVMATKGVSFIKDNIIFIIMFSQDNQVSESEYSDFVNSFEFTNDNL